MKLLFAIPCYGGLLNSATAGAVFYAGKLLDREGIENAFFTIQNESFVPTARNIIAGAFMRSDFTHLMCIDADIGFEPTDIIKLVKAEKEFVSGAYVVKSEEEPRFTLLGYDKENNTVESVGLGFCLINRTVFGKIEMVSEKLKPQKSWGFTDRVSNYYGPIIENDELLGEDVSFCRRCRKVNVQINIDPTIQLIHYGQKGYTGNLDACNKRLDI